MRDDKFFMERALRLAKKGRGQTNPNPMVGAVIVKNNKVAGYGYHKRAGLDHAEVVAIKKAGPKAKGATLYVNLEPCDHFGRTPPCTEAIIKSGIKKVIAAMKDPNPINNGRGLKRLKEAGIGVISGILEQEAAQLNEVFVKYIKTGTPFVIVKVAQSLDGKIATRAGDSKWISSEDSRILVHRLRKQVDAIMVGANTIIKDNPLLTSRGLDCRPKTKDQRPKDRQPLKVVVDHKLRIPYYSRIFSKDSPGKVIIATTKKAPKNKIKNFAELNCEILILKEKNKRMDLRHLMKELGKRKITSIMAEGGGELIGSLVEARLVDRFLFFIAPKIIGGRDAITSVEGRGVDRVSKALSLKNTQYKTIGRDLLITCLPE